MKLRSALRCAAAAGSGLIVTTTALLGPAPAGASTAGTLAQAQASGQPVLRLIAAQNKITAPSFKGQVFLDPGIYLAALRAPLVLHVQRASDASTITVSQVIRRPDGSTLTRHLPDSALAGFNGLRDFATLRMVNARGKVVGSRRLQFCPNGNPQRSNPNSQPTSPYPLECSAFDPFQQAIVWGLARGWAAEPEAGDSPFFGAVTFKLKPGTYEAIEVITRRFARLFHISARDAKAAVTVKVTKGSTCCAGPPVPAARRGAARRWPLPSLPSVPYLRHPPSSVLPDLVPLPSWGITTSHLRATKKRPGIDLLDFGATVTVAGSSQLDVEGFRAGGSPTMKAYQYFWRGSRIVGRARAGTMGFSGYNNWHFRQFAGYRLLNAARKVALRSHKEGFCIAPTDPINLLLPGAAWQPAFTAFSGECGDPAALWVQEQLPLGWADTYEQSVPGESFDITHLPNGTYYIEVTANPLRQLHESDTSNDASLRKVILGGTRGHRTVRVPAVHGIDPER